MPDMPTIETERLILRPHRLDDFDACSALWADADVVRHIGGTPSTREQSWARMIRYAGLWHHLGFGFLAIEEKSSGRFVGEAGFHEVLRDIVPSIEGTLEAGWAFSPSVHGRGYATEALQAMIGWAEAKLPDRRMTCIIAPENAPSLRLAEKLGFRQIALTTYSGKPTILFERSAENSVA
ncbi:GNAT family N-acetyltransferase [Rhizobium sp. BK376]|uniref:GNAT family N-acetyltransferase n=1 Tax=Rhizobium sp. BK376 TaxID=2512149 RepID=UPI001053E8C9|nr:GNAT family N-acetyltransferase [Rhizobium sp. BK376]TCR92936.1 RimJ/RimL family protein N-acetyltransferase [Rhizobium sp. BK376]